MQRMNLHSLVREPHMELPRFPVARRVPRCKVQHVLMANGIGDLSSSSLSVRRKIEHPTAAVLGEKPHVDMPDHQVLLQDICL